MEKSLMLDEVQIKLIENNYKDIRRIFGKKLLKSNIRAAINEDYSTLLREGLNLLPEITMEWMAKKAQKISFRQFAAQRCMWRLIDKYRLSDPKFRVAKNYSRIFDIAKEELVKDNIPVDEYSIYAKINEMGYGYVDDTLIYRKTLPEYRKKNATPTMIKMRQKYVAPASQFLGSVDWLDLKENLLDRSFAGGKQFEIYHKLLKDYLLPKAEGLAYKTLGEIGKECGLSKHMLHKLIHSDRMKFFVSNMIK